MDFFLNLRTWVINLGQYFYDNPSTAAILAGVMFILGLLGIEAHELYRKRHVIDPGCGFCSSANGAPITKVVRHWRWRGVVALETFNPVTPGHVVVVSRWHTRDAGVNPRLSGLLMRCAAEMVTELDNANIITSKGRWATQNFDHTHVHVVPRRRGDNLPMPWTGQVNSEDLTSR